jgi:outer membrane protein assembly factor BamA
MPRAARDRFETRDYRPHFGIDIAGVGLAVDPDFGEVGNGGEIALSDVLGNHRIFVFLGNTSEGFDDFWRRLNVGLTYVNLSHRLNYAVSLFHLTSSWAEAFSLFRTERRYGGALGLRYPLSKFARLDGSIVLRRVERTLDVEGFDFDEGSSFLATTFLTYVSDRTLWTIGGPREGWRYYLTLGHTFDLQGRGFDSSTLHWDARIYLPLGKRLVWAQRFLTRSAWGADLQLFYLGGPWDLRGYSFRRFVGRTVVLYSTELRFPLLDRLALHFPFGKVEMPVMRGSLFFDAGRTSRFVADSGWVGALGFSAEMDLGYAPVLRLNFTRTTDFDTISDDFHVGLFIGYNY